MNEQITAYLAHLETNRRASPLFVKNCRSTLQRFNAWLGDRPLTEQTIAEFLATIPNPASANVVGVRIAGYLRYLKHDAEIVRAKEPQREIEALSSQEIERLVEAAAWVSKTSAGIILFLSLTGLRFGEFCSLQPESVRTRDGITFLEVIGKGNKQRFVPLNARAQELLKVIPFGLTFTQQDTLRRHMARAGVAARMPFHIHPHLLRASFISILLNEKKVEAIKVARIVGHSSVNTMLKHYYRENIAELAELVA